MDNPTFNLIQLVLVYTKYTQVITYFLLHQLFKLLVKAST